MSAESSAAPGRWVTADAEYQRGIMDALSDPSIRMIAVPKAAQVGWTEVLNNIIGFHIAQDAAPLLIIQPTLEMGEAWSKDRLAPMLRDTPALRGLVQDPRARDSGNTLLHKNFPGGHLTVVGANSPASLASRPIRIVLADEVDRYPVSAGSEGDPLKLAAKRQTTFWNRKTLLGSTPTVADTSVIWREWQRSDKRRFMVPCPHCGHAQHLRWERVHWDKEKDEAGETIRHLPHTAHYSCEECGALWSDAERWAAIRKGQWSATAEATGIAGFHIPGFLSPWLTLEAIVREFIDAQGRPELLQVWVNTVLGEPWEDRGEQVDASAFINRREMFDDQTLPESVRVVTAGVDVQDDRLEVQFVAWGRGEESWPCRYEILRGDPAQAEVWSDLDRVLLERFATVDGRRLMVRSACIDTGGHHAASVYSFCRTRRMRRVFPTKGQSGPRQIWPKRSSRGGVKGAEQVYIIGVDTAKDSIYGRLRIAKPGAGFVHFPNADGFEQGYFDQLTAEKVVTRYRHGRPLRVWELKKKGARNEALDTFVYALAALKALPLRLDRVPRFKPDETDEADMAYPPDETTIGPVADEAPQPAAPFSLPAAVEPERRADAPRPRSQSRPARRISHSSYFG